MAPFAAEASPAVTTQCPVAALALETQHMVDAMIAADEAMLGAPPDDTAARLNHQKRHDTLFDLIAFRKHQAITTAAASAHGALHQLAISAAMVEELYELTPGARDNHADWRRATELRDLLKWASYSIAGVLERACSEPREKLCIELYMPASNNPFGAARLDREEAGDRGSRLDGSDEAQADLGNLAILLDLLVDEECGLVRHGMGQAQIDALDRIGALAWTARDLARRASVL